MNLDRETFETLKEIKHLLQQILNVISQISAAISAAGGLTAAQAQQVLTALQTLLAQITTPPPPPPPPTGPTITGLNPGISPIGGQVTITGSGFGTSQGTGSVSFNGVVGTVVTWMDSSIVATVPAGATTGPVTVTTASGGTASTNLTVH